MFNEKRMFLKNNNLIEFFGRGEEPEKWGPQK